METEYLSLCPQEPDPCHYHQSLNATHTDTHTHTHPIRLHSSTSKKSHLHTRRRENLKSPYFKITLRSLSKITYHFVGHTARNILAVSIQLIKYLKI
jgi:hypothetical protein